MSPEWQVVAAVASGISALMASVAAILAWRSGRRSERMFELQRRPWIRLVPDPTHLALDTKGDRRMASLLIENFGAGGACETRVGARFDNADTPLHEHSRIWSPGLTNQEWRGKQLLLCTPGERIGYHVGPLAQSPEQTHLHVFCEYRGNETGERYYSESVLVPTPELKVIRYYQGTIHSNGAIQYSPWEDVEGNDGK